MLWSILKHLCPIKQLSTDKDVVKDSKAPMCY